MNLCKFWLTPTMTNSLQPLRGPRKNLTKVCLSRLRNLFQIAWSSLCKLRRVIISMLAMRRNFLNWPFKLRQEKVSQDQSRLGREKTQPTVQTRKRLLLLQRKVPRKVSLKLKKKVLKIKWLLSSRRSMISHALSGSRKMILNHIQMLNLSSTSSLMMSRLKFWKWNEIFGSGLIKFKVAKSKLQEIVQNLPIALVIKNELINNLIFDHHYPNIQKFLWLTPI